MYRPGAFLLAFALACSAGPSADPRPLVVASVPPQQFVVDQIAGDLVRSRTMIPRAASPATYAPSLAELRALAEASVYVKVGHPAFPFEAAWLDDLIAESTDLVVVDGSAGVARRQGDPHVWVAPLHAERLALDVHAALVALLPEHEVALSENLARFRRDVALLDTEIRKLLEGREGREFLVFHPAWGYFAEAYGLRQVAVENDHKEPGARELAALIERSRGAATVVFVQPQFDAAAAELIAAEVGARVVAIDPLAYQWDESLRSAAQAIAEALDP